MKTDTVLRIANWSMYSSFVAFIVTVVLAYGLENYFPLMLVTLLHVSQLVLAGLFKVAYVVRLVSQKQLGMTVS